MSYRTFNADNVRCDLEAGIVKAQQDIDNVESQRLQKFADDYNKSLGWFSRKILRCKDITKDEAWETMDTFDRLEVVCAYSSQQDDLKRLKKLLEACNAEGAEREIFLNVSDICLIEYWKDAK